MDALVKFIWWFMEMTFGISLLITLCRLVGLIDLYHHRCDYSWLEGLSVKDFKYSLRKAVILSILNTVVFVVLCFIGV